MLKPLGVRFPAHKILALYDWEPFNAMADHIFVVGKVNRTGILSRIFKTKTVAVNANCILPIDEIYSTIAYKFPIQRDTLISQSQSGRTVFADLVIERIPTK